MRRKSPWGGPKYRREPLPENDWPTAFFDTVDVRPGSRIIQIGAGDGHLTGRLVAAAREGFTLGVEFDGGRYADLLTDPRFSGSPRAAFFNADPCAPPSYVPHAPFDILAAHVALERCPNHTRLFSRYIRLIRQGGEAYCEMACQDDLADVRAALAEAAATERLASCFKAFRYPYKLMSKDEALSILMETGYGEVAVNIRKFPMEIPAASRRAWLMRGPAHPYLDGLPEREREVFLDEAEARLPFSGGAWAVERRVLSIHGRRLWGDIGPDDLFPGGPPETLD